MEAAAISRVFAFRLGKRNCWAQGQALTHPSITLALHAGEFPSSLDVSVSMTPAEARAMAVALEAAATHADLRHRPYAHAGAMKKDGSPMPKPLMIDIFCGLGGWAEGGLAEGYDVVGFDIEQHVYGEHRYPAQLVIQDVLTLHGSQFRSAALIVASPPCQEYSYMAMPWTKAKAKAADYRSGKLDVKQLTTLFDACFRIQREACEAAGRHVPMVVENVRGAQKWVGRARWNFGSFYLWGDVPALMPVPARAVKVGGLDWKHPDDPRHRKGQAFNPAAQGQAVREGRKNNGGSWFNIAHNTTSGKGQNPDGRKNPGIKLGDVGFNVASAHKFGHMVEGVKIKRSERDKRDHIGTKRKFASAMIAKIPLPLSRHIARTYLPIEQRTAA